MDNNYIELLKYRQSMYRLLSSIYIEEIDKDMLEKLKRLKLPKISKPVLNWQMDFNAGYELVEKYLAEYEGLSEERTTEKLDFLAADYAKVFLAAGQADGKAAFPYESIYSGNDSEFGGSVQENLKVLYTAKGLKMREDMFKIMEDHIGLELNYMAELLKAQIEALEAGDEEASKGSMKDQVKFFRDHLLKWATSFTNDIYKYSDTDFYKGFARITAGFLGFEQAVLKDRELSKKQGE